MVTNSAVAFFCNHLPDITPAIIYVPSSKYGNGYKNVAAFNCRSNNKFIVSINRIL